MRYGRIDGLDKDISKLVIGADWFQEAEEGKALAVLDAFAEAGGNCIDMAHIYGGGQGQRIVGRWMRARGNRKQIVLLDKGCHPIDGRNRITPEDLESDISDNLKRTRTESIDIFALHRDDPAVGVDEIVSMLTDQKERGRIHALGASNWRHERVQSANAWAARKLLPGFSMSNPNLSLAKVNEPHWEGCITIDRDGRLWHERNDFPLFAWASQGGGFFAGKDTPHIRRVYWNGENLARKVRAASLAKRMGAEPLSVVLAWALCQPFPTWALIGPRTPAEVRSCAAALDLRLSSTDREWLEFGG